MRKLRFLVKTGVFLFITFLIVMTGLYAYAYFSPKLELANIGQMYIYDKENTLVYQGSGTSEWVNLENISSHLKK